MWFHDLEQVAEPGNWFPCFCYKQSQEGGRKGTVWPEDESENPGYSLPTVTLNAEVRLSWAQCWK